MTKYQDGDPLFIPGSVSGYDKKSGKFRSANGPFTTRAKALDEWSKTDPKSVYGEMVKVDFAPISRAAERLETLIVGMTYDQMSRSLDWKWYTKSAEAQPVPSSILAQMNLAEFYCASEGDVFQTIELPIDVGLRFDPERDVQCKNKGIERDLREFYSTEGIDLYQNLYWIWLTTAIYGQCFPLEVWPRKGNEITAAFNKDEMPMIYHLSPKNVWVGKMLMYGRYDMAMTPGDVQLWTEQLIDQNIPPMMYVSLARKPNESIQQGHVPLNPEYCMPIRAKSMPWQRYAQPPISRAFRAISTRQVLEEMIRSTIEGYKNQLWAFLLGDEDHPPSVLNMTTLKSQLNSFNAERTGMLVYWNAPLKIEQHAPKTLDQVLGNDAWQSLTFHIMRQLGTNPRLISGEVSTRGGGRDVEVDIRILTERIKFWHRQMIRWERNLRMHWAAWSGANPKDVASAQVDFGHLDLVVETIQQRLQPLFQMGLLSHRTPLEEAGYSYETELQRKKEESRDSELFSPPPTFNQTASPFGGGPKETANAPEGKPAAGTKNPDQKVKANVHWPDSL